MMSSEIDDDNDMTSPTTVAVAKAAATGTLLEAAFCDPAYSWPVAGKHVMKLQAAADDDDDDDSVVTSDSMKHRMTLPPKPHDYHKYAWWKCCGGRSNNTGVDSIAFRAYESRRADALLARKEYAASKKTRAKNGRQYQRSSKKQEYTAVPEGILVYRLDTSQRLLQLLSRPHAKTDLAQLVTEMTIVTAAPSTDPSRRGLLLKGEDGTTITLIACEQRTATAWLEAMSLMHAKKNRSVLRKGGAFKSLWNKERLKDHELEEIENSYLNLASYSNKLIRAGALPGSKKGSGGAGGIYYSMERVENGGDTKQENEALEAIAKRRAVIKDSWDFYRMICSLLRDRNKYNEAFRRMQLDPVYPYLNSMTGLNDPGDVGYENADKTVVQNDLAIYSQMSKTQVAKHLVEQAEMAMSSLVEICKALAGSLGMEEVGIGPIKEPEAAIRKAEKKYDGDLLKVTDYCRALLVVKDLPSLLALLELARDSFGPLIRRVKLSSLKEDHKAKPGGYRDCIINVELKGHICEIQIHVWPIWIICGVDGFRHYRHCVEYNTDSFDDAYDALDGLDRKTMAELIVMAEEAVAETPLDNLEWYHEKFILDYFAEAGLFMKHGLDVWAEIILRQLIKLRSNAPDIGPDHHETIVLYKYLQRALRAQDKYDEAKEIQGRVTASETAKSKEKKQAEQSIFESILNAPAEAFDMILDPNRKDREEEQKLRKDVKASKKRWRMIRAERFAFLDADLNVSSADEKKTESSRK